ncbi:hypothetical protein SAMN05216405_1403 [Lachnospiraceae bacterium NLAE-zl-G231]|uniref:Uncharacterized protein n=1 Tax=Eisenbergiella tayi TaxID=1432052 RepID=A0A1E3A2C0_9FIRM|nr:hypothetical protein BEH84_06125 [Eisenbergiella tayi]ODM07794.1 hypothetical protein BEI61_03685 [Eisenbergiella tayi]CUQ31041.1 Uncharacterised protein [Fusicatenibacter sp. 2789STDY5834925]SFI19361.1 hypothetical protein SAMN05216405_1403 [Lachnospiraceae bacterium NLAE-zl-G231]
MLPGVVKAVKRPWEMSLPTGRGMYFHKKTTPELPVVVKCRLSPL